MSSLHHLAGLSLASFVAVAACGGGDNPSGFGETGDGGSGSSSGGSGGGSGSSGGSYGHLGGDASGSSSGGAGADAGCATATAKATKQPVYMEFVQDGSGSMGQDSKWKAVVPALQSIFSTIEKSADTGEGVGLIVFSDSKDPTNGRGAYPDKADVPLAYVSSSQLTALDGRLGGKPGGGTPTGTALKGAYSYLESLVPPSPLAAGGQKVLVILTDGVPESDECDIPAGGGYDYAKNPCVVMAAAELAKPAPEGPILTFVIGTGQFPSKSLQNYDPSFLGYLAQAGGTGPKGCTPGDNSTTAGLCYFSVDPTTGNSTTTETAFENAITAIRGQVLSCTFPLAIHTDAGAIDPSKVNVTVNGKIVLQGGANGWSYNNPSNPTSITFNGTSCTSLKSDPSADVQIELGCKTQTSSAN